MPPSAMVTGQFNDSYPPIVDGVAIVTQNYARWLNRTCGPGWVVTVQAPGSVDDGDPPVLRYRSIPLPTRPPYRLGLPGLDPEFRARLARIPFDIVQAHNPFAAGALALRTARARNIPVVATFHTKYREDFRRVVRSQRLAHAIARHFTAFYSRVDEVWTPSEASIGVLREYGYEGPVQVMPNGCDLEPPADPAALRAQVDGTAGSRPDDFVMLYVGQIIWEKNLRVLLEAIAGLRRGGRRFWMWFVGGGSDEAAMQEAARHAGIDDRVRFFGRVRDRQRMAEIYARADLLLFPSRYDTSSLVQQEAAAFRLPGLFTRGATTASLVRDGENGFLAEDQSGRWTAAIGSLMADPSAIRRAGDGAFRTLYRSWESVVEEVHLRYRSLIERHRRAGGMG